MVAAWRNVPSAAFYFSCRHFRGTGDGAAAREGHRAQCHRAADSTARRGGVWAGFAVSRAGIRAGLPDRAVDGPAARGCAEYSGAFDDFDGSGVLGDGAIRRARAIERGLAAASAHPRNSRGLGWWDGNRDGYAAIVDDASSALFALADRVLYRRRSYLRCAAGVAFSAAPVERFRVCGPGGGIFSVHGNRAAQRGAHVSGHWRGGIRGVRAVGGVRRVADPPVRGLRLLAYESQLSSDALRDFAGDHVLRVFLVPVGIAEACL